QIHEIRKRMASRVNSSFTLIPNQKHRRSNRRSSYFSNTVITDSQLLSTLGNFKALPLEIFHMILRYLSVFFSVIINELTYKLIDCGNSNVLVVKLFICVCVYVLLLLVKDVSMLSMVSKTVSQHIIDYISTSSGSKRLLLQDFHNLELPDGRQDSTILEHYRSLGNLCNVMRIVNM
ncbi:F-box only protein 47, partial [Camelus dromedarius]